MATVKTLLLFLLSGAFVGALIVSLIAPSYLQWDNTPRMGQGLCPCGETTRDTATRLLTGQAEGAAAGAVVFLVVGIVLEVRRRRNPAAPPPAAAAPAA